MNVSKYIEKINDLPFREVSVGLTTIHLFSENEVFDGQLGYSVDTIGNSLVGEKNGDWKKTWLVIGYEDLCGDPIFTDLDKKNFPVFTAIHGTGNWNEKLIAESFDNFIKSLKFVSEFQTKEQAIKKIQSLNQQIDLEFWMLLFETD